MRSDDNGEWNIEEMQHYMSVEEIEAIKDIQIASSDQQDLLTWSHTKHGDLTVRSAYHLELTRTKGAASSSSPKDVEELWKKVWGAKVPEKVKNLVWRALREGLPTMANMKKRGMQVDCVCPRCGEGAETTVHTLLLCREARTLWRMSPARLEVGEWNNNMMEWCLEMTPKCKEEGGWEMIMMFMWQVWNNRNCWVFERKKMEPGLACSRTVGLLGEYFAAKQRSMDDAMTSNQPQQAWKAPTQGRVKVNTDVAVRALGRT